jgi:hypothetical protein
MSRTFQERVNDWMLACFGPELSKDRIERGYRFLEEALELVQSLGCTRSEAYQLVEYVFGRPAGHPSQECGGVMVTLAALSNAASMNMYDYGEIELELNWTNIESIRSKQKDKPHLPVSI